jgi:hypothetical protein
MADHDETQRTPLKRQTYFRVPTLTSFSNLIEEQLESTSMLQEEFEKTGMIKTISFDELLNYKEK